MEGEKLGLRQLGLEFLDLPNKIKGERILQFTEEALLYANEEFFFQPASMSGKYHPAYALGVGGLLRHTKAAIIVAEELFPLWGFSLKTQDYILSALALHDLEKPSKLHSIEVKLKLEPLRDKYIKEFDQIIPLLESHMGQWDQYGKLPRPKNKAQHFVHLCDYLASRKSIIVELGINE